MDGNSSDWPRPLSARIGAAIRSTREQQHISALKLSERTRALGYPVHRNAIAKMEDGDRDITVPELVAIAAALNTVPLALAMPVFVPGAEVIPAGDDHPAVHNPASAPAVEILPGITMVPAAAIGWFSGRGPSNPAGTERNPATTWELDRVMELIDIDRRLDAHRRLYGSESDPAAVEQHRALIATLQARRDELADALGGDDVGG
jgi:transcriptional regulator with XRE-family HTH domain